MANTFAAALFLLLASQQTQQPPVIRSGVEYVLVDVQVTGRDGKPVAGLKPEQFEVNIDGKNRPTVRAELINLNSTTAAEPAAVGATASTTPAGTTAESRTIIIAVDQATLLAANEPAAHEVIKRLLALVHPNDRVGLVAYPQPGIAIAPTTDRQVILDGVKRIGGQLQVPHGRIQLTLPEAVDWSANDPQVKASITQKYCNAGDQMCMREVEMAASDHIQTFQMQTMRSVSGMQSVVEAVREYPGRKTFVVVSAGFVIPDRMGGKPDARFESELLGRRAAEANAVIYTLHLDLSFLTNFSSASANRDLQTWFRSASMLANGLERFTGFAGGTVISVPASPERALQRLLTETSSYYLLAVEALPEHRDGKTHRITVKVKQGGTTVRARNSVLIPKSGG